MTSNGSVAGERLTVPGWENRTIETKEQLQEYRQARRRYRHQLMEEVKLGFSPYRSTHIRKF